jgi:hypothetical protein
MAVLMLSFAALAAQAADAPQPKPVQKTPPPAAKPEAKSAAADRLTLDATTVSGNRELPKVLYIVPWKKADLGNLPAQPFNTLLDEALAPVDREVFRREVDYYGILTAKPAAAKAGAQ